MDDTFRIYVDQLREGGQQEISEECSPGFLSHEEGELEFKKPVVFSGVAYLATDNLILNLHVEAEALLPCRVCNDWVSASVEIENFYLTKSLDEIKSGIYDFKDALREEILLAVPHFAECNNGSCPHRKEIEKYLSGKENKDTYHPFEGL